MSRSPEDHNSTPWVAGASTEDKPPSLPPPRAPPPPPPSDSETHLYQTLEPPDAGSPTSSTEEEDPYAESHLYQTLEPPSEGEGGEGEEAGGSQPISPHAETDFAPAEYESYRRRDGGTTPLYHILEPGRKGSNDGGGETHVNPAQFLDAEYEELKRRSEAHVYQILQCPPTAGGQGGGGYVNRPVGGAAGRGSKDLTPQSGNHTSISYHAYSGPTEHSTNTTGSKDRYDVGKFGEGSSTSSKAFKMALMACGVLVLCVAMAIAISALVLVLKKSPEAAASACQCGGEVQELFRLVAGNNERLGQLNTLLGNIDDLRDMFNTIQQNTEAITDQQELSDYNQERIRKNERNISVNANLLGIVGETASRINDTLTSRVESLGEKVTALRSGLNCTRSTEATCSFSERRCTTPGVALEREGEVVLGFGCLITGEGVGPLMSGGEEENSRSLRTAAIESGNSIACVCSTSEDLDAPATCELRITRCI